MYIAPCESLKVFYGITNCLPPLLRTDHFVLLLQNPLEGGAQEGLGQQDTIVKGVII